MFTTALIGVDHSAAQDPLLECVPDLVSWGIERVVLAHVIHVDYGRFGGLGHEDLYRDWLEQRAEPLRGGGLEIQTSVTASGRPAFELLARAREHRADLVVVGSRSQKLTERLFLGSVATEVIRSSDLPVLIERLEPDPSGGEERCVTVCSRNLERLLLATDLSDESAAAEHAVVALAGRAGSVDCLVVVDGGAPGAIAISTDHAEDAAASILERITEAGGRGAVRVEHGDPRERIPAIAAEDYTLVVVGKHGRGRVTGTVIGTTAIRVAEVAAVSVLLVPA